MRHIVAGYDGSANGFARVQRPRRVASALDRSRSACRKAALAERSRRRNRRWRPPTEWSAQFVSEPTSVPLSRRFVSDLVVANCMAWARPLRRWTASLSIEENQAVRGRGANRSFQSFGRGRRKVDEPNPVVQNPRRGHSQSSLAPRSRRAMREQRGAPATRTDPI